MVAIPSLRIGEPLTSGRLTVFPLFVDASSKLDYLLADEALADGSAVVSEISEGGSVPQLAVENSNDRLVLFLEGQELRGAKQNRILNSSLLIAAKSKAVLPVSCVEQGRWRHISKHFAPSDVYSSAKLRAVMKPTVTASLKRGGSHSSDQGAIWKEVSRQMESLGSHSETMAMEDTFHAHKPRIDKTVAEILYPEGAVGLAVALGGKLIAVDVFDTPKTCRSVWPRLLSGMALDELEEKSGETATTSQVTQALNLLDSADWQPVTPAGVGEEHRAETTDHWHGSLLSLDGTLVHASLISA